MLLERLMGSLKKNRKKIRKTRKVAGWIGPEKLGQVGVAHFKAENGCLERPYAIHLGRYTSVVWDT